MSAALKSLEEQYAVEVLKPDADEGFLKRLERGIRGLKGIKQPADAATPAGNAAIDTAQVEMVEAETDDIPVRHCTVPRNQYGQLCVDSIKDYLAGSGQMLVSIGNGCYPKCKDGWTLNSYSAIPIQLHVAPKLVRQAIATCSSHDVCQELTLMRLSN
ncbi:hypothetical protein ABBQ38_000687 [Trebouxia sp. C0009 RCD-2024]